MAAKEKKPAAPIEAWGRTWLVVSGASKGFGAEICKEFAPLLGDESLILGLARSVDGLKKTKDAVQSANPKIKFALSRLDLIDFTSEGVQKVLQESLDATDRKFDRCVIVHNAGSLGTLDYLKELSNPQEINSYFTCNLSSVITLNAHFLALSKNLATRPKINVINISSICATLPIKSWGLYCAGKAARKMLFEVLALEEQDVDILSYSPGPLKGEMQNFARESADGETRAMFRDLHEENKLLEMKESVGRLLYILRFGKYSSGGSVDYYDEV